MAELKKQQGEEEAIEEEEAIQEVPKSEHNDDPERLKELKPLASASNALSFWAYLILSVSLVTLFFAALNYSLHTNRDDASWFLSLPDDLRIHYSQGKLIKVHIGSDPHHQVQVFCIENGARAPDATTILLVHGLGASSYSFRHVLTLLGSAGFRAVAVDLPGSGFSDGLAGRSLKWGGALGKISEFYNDVKEKGLFWGFDHLVEHGYIPYEETSSSRVSEKKLVDSWYGSEEMGRLLEQVVDSLSLAPVHLVAHDSALGPVASFASANSGVVQSITFVDSSSHSAAFPSWILGAPILREFVLGSRPLFSGLLRLCCSRALDGSAADGYRVLLKRKGGRAEVVASGNALNYSFDLREWANSEEVKGLPLQVLWSHMSADLWIDEGRRVAHSLPQAKFVPHYGGRWPQEGAAEEIAEKLAEFILSLPKSHRQAEEESPSEHNMFDEANFDSLHEFHHHGYHDQDHYQYDGHGHDHANSYLNAYGLNYEW